MAGPRVHPVARVQYVCTVSNESGPSVGAVVKSVEPIAGFTSVKLLELSNL